MTLETTLGDEGRRALLDQAIRRVLQHRGLLDDIRREFARLLAEEPEEDGPHSHLWFPTCRLSDPPIDVFDCACGARGMMRHAVAMSGVIEVMEPKPGGSAAN